MHFGLAIVLTVQPQNEFIPLNKFTRKLSTPTPPSPNREKKEIEVKQRLWKMPVVCVL